MHLRSIAIENIPGDTFGLEFIAFGLTPNLNHDNIERLLFQFMYDILTFKSNIYFFSYFKYVHEDETLIYTPDIEIYYDKYPDILLSYKSNNKTTNYNIVGETRNKYAEIIGVDKILQFLGGIVSTLGNIKND